MSVKERIQAVFILQKFVRMSRFLLPAYLDLIRQKKINSGDQRRLNKINNVYEAFRASSEMSELLINSNILALIKSTYKLSKSNYNAKNSEMYASFISESDSLIQCWNRQILN